METRTCEQCGTTFRRRGGSPGAWQGRRYCSAGCYGAARARAKAAAEAAIVRDGRKTCTRCDRHLPLTDFGTRGATGQARCKACVRETARAAERGRRSALKHRYNLTLEQYEAMLEEQGHACAICEVPFDTTVPHVDHSHETGLVRALLCPGCNRGIGQMADDPARLRAAAEYLERAW